MNKNIKVGILGAGISGLSIGRLLSTKFDVEILEASNCVGGIARTRDIDGITYHPTGGHCFNSKHEDVLNFVFNEIMPKEEWNLVNRKASIRFLDHLISYPIEFSIKEINKFNADLALSITKDFLSTGDNDLYDNLEDWFRKKFGNTLSEFYFIPYNSKIWGKPPREMSYEWVKDKLPIPNKNDFFQSLVGTATDSMPHSFFYYPKSNNQNTFIDALSRNLNIVHDFRVRSIKKSNNKWIINDANKYDLLISTLPLNLLPGLIQADMPEDIIDSAKKLKYNKISTMLWRTTGTNDTWTYIPSPDSIFHRYIHIGNFFNPIKNYSITETVGVRSYDEMVQEGKKDPFLIEPLDYHVSDHAYVVFDENYGESLKKIRNYLENDTFYLLGRFGEWQYYNMDICIKKSLDLATTIFERKYNESV